MARSLSPASYFSRNTSRIRRIDNLSVDIQQTSSGTRSPLPAQTVARPAQGTPCSGARDPVQSLPALPWKPCPRSRGSSARDRVEYATEEQRADDEGRTEPKCPAMQCHVSLQCGGLKNAEAK